MNRTNHNRLQTSVLLLAVFALFGSSSGVTQGVDAPSREALAAAAELVHWSGAPGGVCAVVGQSDADLALALAKHGSFVVHCLCTDAQTRGSVRAAIRRRGVYGAVSADVFRHTGLPYTNDLVNIAVVDSYPDLKKKGLSPAEILRALAPLGVMQVGTSAQSAGTEAWAENLAGEMKKLGAQEVSVVGTGGTWVRARKPWPDNIDEWTHYLHGADCNPVARDSVIGPPKHCQWTSDPMWQRSHETDSSISTLVTARGRLFYIEDQAPISLAGDHPLPDKWFLVARDAFNGVALWKVPIRRWGWREWKHSWFNTRPGDVPLNIQKRLVAVGDKVYVTLGYRAPVCELDARTGEILKTYAGTERTGEILYLDGTLVLSIVDGDEVRLAAVDARTGKRLWLSENAYGGTTVDYVRWTAMRGSTKPAKLDPTINMSTDGEAVGLIDGMDVVCLDFRTGKERWRSRFPSDPADLGAGGILSRGNLWVGTVIVSDGVVLHASPSVLAAFSATTGEQLWTQPKKYLGHLWYEWKDVFVIDGLVWTWSSETRSEQLDTGNSRQKQRTHYPVSVNGYDLKTGEMKKSVSLGAIFKTYHHHRCYRNKATLRYILASRRGTEYVDLREGKHSVNNWVRGTCHVGMMPANGLQYAPAHPCVCYINEKINGMNALAPAREGETLDAGDRPPVLEKGPAYADVPSAAKAPADSDWPAFRHDSMRTGSVDASLPDGTARLWRVSVGARLSPPIAVDGRLFVALIDEHHVACLDAEDGGKQWEYAAGARIDSPPTYYNGAVLFGSSDGWVYCLRAADGCLAWRMRAAPAETLIGAFGQLESAWPVHGSVLIHDGIAYFAAGRSSQLDGGIRVYGVDATTAEVRHRIGLDGPHYNVDNITQNFRLPMGALPHVMMSDGSKIFMHSETFDMELKRQSGTPALQTRCGFLDDSYFKRTPWTLGRGDYGRLIVHDAKSMYCVRMFDSLRGLDPTVYFTPGRNGYLLFGKNVGGDENAWMKRVRVRIRAMAFAGSRLVVAGPPDVVDSDDPLGAFEGRKGGMLYVFDSVSGDQIDEHKLAFPPVFNGAAVAGSRLYVCEEDGSISCFGKK